MEDEHQEGAVRFIGGKRNGFYCVSIYEPDKERMVEALKIVLAIKPRNDSQQVKLTGIDDTPKK